MPAMEPFKRFSAVAVPIDITNCDTDQIIPARFLRRPRNDPDYPTFLLHDLRFASAGTETEFIYNRPPYRGGRIVVTDVNWGCGSSREAAVDALRANLIRSVIAPAFGDIHYGNCIKNGVLPVRLTAEACEKLRLLLHQSPGATISIDLPAQCVTGPDGQRYQFEIESLDKQRLIHGLDDISLTLEYEAKINAFEQEYLANNRWLVPKASV